MDVNCVNVLVLFRRAPVTFCKTLSHWLAFTLRYFTMRFLSSTHIHVYIYININSSYIDYQH